MRQILLWTLAAMMIATAPAVTAMAEGTGCQDMATDPDCREKALDCAENEPCLMNEEPTFGDCGGEVCAYGDPECIDCTGMPTCMDGTAANCDPDLQYFDGRGPEGCENCRTNSANVQGVVGFGLLAGLLGMVAVLAWARRF